MRNENSRRFIGKLHVALLAILLPVSFCGHTQNSPRIDSLKKIIAGAATDSVKIISLIELSIEYQFSNYDQAKRLAEEAT